MASITPGASAASTTMPPSGISSAASCCSPPVAERPTEGVAAHSGPLLLGPAFFDLRLGGAQIAAGRIECAARLVEAAAFKQQQRQLDAALRLAQRVPHLVA